MLNKSAYLHMPLSGALARQRENLIGKMTHYAEVGAYSLMVTKEVGLRGPFWHIVVSKGFCVVARDIHYAGPDQAWRRGSGMLAVLIGVEVKESMICDDGNVIGVANYKTNPAYTINGAAVMSIPKSLNGGRVPSLEECADILDGVSIKESDGMIFAAHDLHNLARAIVLEVVAELSGASAGAALTVTGDGTTRGVKYVMWSGRRSHTLHAVATSPTRLRAHWSGFVENCALDEMRKEPPTMYDRIQERRRASVPAAPLEPGNPCNDCGACLHVDQSDQCDDCRQVAPSVVNLYLCPICKHEWRDAWIAVDSDDCPNCGAKNVEPYDSEHDDDEAAE
jgi:hypothetical protein